VPEILSTFFINRKGLSFGSDTAFKEDVKIKEHYRSVVHAAEIYAVDSSNPRELAKAWINLGNLAAAVTIPWDDQPHSCPEFAISCYQKAVACDASCDAAWHNLAVLSVRIGITDYLAKTFRSAQPGIDEFIAQARVNRNLVVFDLPPKVQGHYFQRPVVSRETVAVMPIAPRPPKNDSTSSHGLVVSWEGSYLDLGSLSHINRQVTDRLVEEKDFQVVTVGANAIPSSMQNDREWKRRARRLRAESPGNVAVTVRHQWPPDWSRPAQGALVVIQPWEFGALPEEWVKSAENVEEFWVPSTYVRSVYVSSGVDSSKVHVIPNGVDVRRCRAAAKPLRLETTKRFKFLFVGGTIGRKGPDVLLQAYLQSFTAADDVCLVIKDFGGSGVYQGMTMGALIEQARQQPGAPEILHLTQELAPDQMPGLFTACDCLVHPYRGEGFGLPILEAMACARPVIVTRGGAADDFVSEHTGWLIDSQRRSIGTTVSSIPLVSDGWLLEPDVNHLATLLRYVATNPAEGKAKGEAGARLAREKYDWSAVTALVADRLKIVARQFAEKFAGAFGNQPVAKEPFKPMSPRCALLGKVDRGMAFLSQKNHAEAWKSACISLDERPFNPPAWLLLGEIAIAAGDFALARRCLGILRPMAPAWKLAREFADKLAGKKEGQPSGLTLPAIPSQPRLTVCLIVKNEEKFLPSCLKSVQGVADQIIVVDTGSQDRSIEIAQAHGAEVHTFEWCDDFSAARNVALEHATGDWVLVLDADEELSPQGREALREELRNDAVMAYRLPIIEADRAGEGCHYVPRLFRNAPGIQFSGRIHEHAFGAVEILRQEWGLDNRLGKAGLIHHGYTAAVTRGRDKVARNRRLLELALAETPHDANLLMNLGLELVRSNELAAGLDKYRDALRLLSLMPSGSVVPELRETLLTQFTTHLLAAGRFNEIVTVLQSKLAAQAGLTASLHFVMGLALMELKQHQLAADQFRQCQSKRNQRGLTPINLEILKAGPNHCLGMCLIAQKQWTEAEQAFRAALVDEPASVTVRMDLARL
ncbi:MAG: glycosyltransferase, partial [Opitutaceae bacterium]|nr:glycosyltransferase [Verrucomicrobiales bacterium]